MILEDVQTYVHTSALEVEGSLSGCSYDYELRQYNRDSQM